MFFFVFFFLFSVFFFIFFFLMIRRPPRSTPFPTRRSSDLGIDIINRQALGDFGGATDAARRLLDDATGEKSEQAIALAHHYLGATLMWRGALPEGTAELQLAAAYLDNDIDGSSAAIRLTVALWTMLALAAALGDRCDEADRMFERARSKLASDAYSQCLLGSMVAIVDQLAGRARKVRYEMEPVWSMATELGSDV